MPESKGVREAPREHAIALVQIPPPMLPAELPEIVEFATVSAPELKIPPPLFLSS